MARTEGVAEFLAVVEHGSFTKAADHLGASKSHVSRQISRLETTLGTRLLTRTTRRVRLTDLGQLYYAACRKAVDTLEEAEADLADLQDQPKGLVRITAPGIYAERFVTPALIRFRQQYPRVDIQLDTQMSTVDLIEGGYDLAIRNSALEDSSLVARKVETRRVLVCGAPDYLNKHDRPLTPDNLGGHQCLRLGDMPWRFMENDRLREVRIRGGFRSDNGRTLVIAARAGLGLIRITDYYVQTELDAGSLEVVLEKFEVKDMATWIVYPDRLHLPTRTRLLIDYLAEALRTPTHAY